MKLRLGLVAVLSLAGSSDVVADPFRQDRQYGGTPIFVTARVYTGRVATQRCGDRSIEQCSSLSMVPESLKCQSRSDGMQICFGKKKLFRGTGPANKAIGAEWREFRLRDGKVAGEWAVIQIVETMTLGAPP